MADPIVMDDTQKSTYQITGFFASDGTTPAKVDGPPTGETTNPDKLTWVPDDASAMTGAFVTADNIPDGPPEAVTATLKADANLDPNVADFITVTQVYMVSHLAPPQPVAASIGVTFGPPVKK